MHGWLNINKPLNVTSHDIVYKARKVLNNKKIGHCGTLDPLAEGVLVLAVGNATRLIQFLKETKKYIAKIKFGEQTNTYDREGKVLNKKDFNFTRGELENKLKNFIGKIKQKPPIFSAIKKNGKKLYELARKNIQFEVNERDVEIFYINLLSYNLPYIELEIFCKSGTYIRSLANDLGISMNTFAYLFELKRIESNEYFKLENSININDISEKSLIQIDKPLNNIEQILLNKNDLLKFRNGQKVMLQTNMSENKVIKVYDENMSCLYGIANFSNGYITPKINFSI
jgi:tRNA pseudouridine55 synthase